VTAQDATTSKSHKNAKARREKKKTEGPTVEVKSKDGVTVISAPKRSFPEQVRLYFKGVVAESRRVSWPSKPQVIGGTVTTLFILVVFSAYLGGMDWVLNSLTFRLGL
jgi:preprotein translocase SecE subunit